MARRAEGLAIRATSFYPAVMTQTNLQNLTHTTQPGLDVERQLPKLATYLGHSHVAYTYWYLSAEPQLLQLAARRLQNSQRVNAP